MLLDIGLLLHVHLLLKTQLLQGHLLGAEVLSLLVVDGVLIREHPVLL